MAMTRHFLARSNVEGSLRQVANADAATRPTRRWKAGRTAGLGASCLTTLLVCGRTTFAQAETASPHRHDRAFTDRIASYVAEAERRFSIPASWIYGVMHVESEGVRHAISPKGAMGLMQIMPKTWEGLRARYHLGANPFDPHDNILAGAAYLREMHDLYGSPGDLAAYNAGPERYEDYRDRHRPLPAETRAYVAKLAPVVGARPLPDRRPEDPINQLFAAAASLFAGPVETQSAAVQTTAHLQPRSKNQRRTVTDLTAITPRSAGLFVRLSSGEQAP
jgi:hypothetical protein